MHHAIRSQCIRIRHWYKRLHPQKASCCSGEATVFESRLLISHCSRLSIENSLGGKFASSMPWELSTPDSPSNWDSGSPYLSLKNLRMDLTIEDRGLPYHKRSLFPHLLCPFSKPWGGSIKAAKWCWFRLSNCSNLPIIYIQSLQRIFKQLS